MINKYQDNLKRVNVIQAVHTTVKINTLIKITDSEKRAASRENQREKIR